MAEKYTKDKLIDELLTHNREVARYMATIGGTLEKLNDTNLLHANAISSNSAVIKDMVAVNTSFLRYVRWILVTVILALIVLAGAEKALDFIPKITL